MGCDIHLYVEKKKESGEWYPLVFKNEYASDDNYLVVCKKQVVQELSYWDENYDNFSPEDMIDRIYNLPIVHEGFYTDRSYYVFSILADVRNARGFVPISEPKGLPDDVSPLVKRSSDSWGCDAHSHSYLTLKEIMDYDWFASSPKLRGVMDIMTYTKFKQTGDPYPYCDSVSGPKIRTIDRGTANEYYIGCSDPNLYVQVEWYEQCSNISDEFLKKLPELVDLSEGDMESIRLVFWFDN